MPSLDQLRLAKTEQRGQFHAMTTFAQAVETVDELSLDEQESLVDLVRRRIAEQRRAELVSEVKSARREFRQGKTRAGTPDEIMAAILK